MSSSSMKPDRWQLVKDLLPAALERRGADRAQFIAEACGSDAALREELESLVEAADDAGDFLDQPAAGAPLALPEPTKDANIGSRLGHYRLIDRIGHGGMGDVYRAVRDDGQYQQEVALKLVRRGMDTEAMLERFRYERQILAFLNHPHIARLLDGGTTEDGRPYFVMEYVEGQPITDYCDANGLSCSERLSLFRQVCAAVEYAHRNLVVHRDLKPSNILVTAEGTPKLLDFGIAKVVLPSMPQAGLTQGATSHLFTPEYASPEQVRGEPVTAATDIYSLGAVLYQLLTGKKPHQFVSFAPTEIERVVCEDDPTRPSSAVGTKPLHASLAGRCLQGDLDQIVLKAMRKEPAHRYASIRLFSDDIRCHLDGMPVTAGAGSFRYRVGKLLRRRRNAVLVGALVSGVAVAGASATLWQAGLARQERERAARRAMDVRRLASSFLVEHDHIVSLPGGTALRSGLVRRALTNLDELARDSDDEPGLRRELAAAYEKMGDVQGKPDAANMGDTRQALASYRKALALREPLALATPQDASLQQDLTRNYQRLSSVLQVIGDLKGAVEYDRKALRVREALLAAEPQNRESLRTVAASYQALAMSEFQADNGVASLAARRKALELYERLNALRAPSEDDRRGHSIALARLGSMVQRNGDPQLALSYYERGLAVARKALQEFPGSATLRVTESVSLRAIGSARSDLRQFDAALAAYREANQVLREVAAADPNDVRTASLLATSHHRMGRVLVLQGQPAKAVAEFQTALATRRRLVAVAPGNVGALVEVADSCAGLGDAAVALGQTATARNWYREAVDVLAPLERQGKLNAESRADLARLRGELGKLR